jgi:hypothetical protein
MRVPEKAAKGPNNFRNYVYASFGREMDKVWLGVASRLWANMYAGRATHHINKAGASYSYASCIGIA